MAVFLRAFFVIGILSVSMVSWSADVAKLRYNTSVYADVKGVGFNHPEGVACSDKSVLVVGDTGNDRLLRYALQEETLKAETEIKIPQLTNPIRVQMNSKGDIFALDGKQRRIVRLAPEGAFKGYLAPEGQSPSTFVPRSFKIDKDDNIYILDVFSGRVLVLNPEGKFQKQINFPKEYGFFSDLAIDPKGNILLIDSIKARVFLAAKGSSTFSPLGATLKEYLSFPTSITTDNRGIIYITDENGAAIGILAQDGSFLGKQLSMGWNEGLLYYPSQTCMNEKGEVFIADRGNSRIQVFTLIK
ncbi:MAG TPA: NHL repeat-containing protein [Syntrophorhabdales bacterium]|nr:NHL repeat-containing protein [Syntrophorhabdales bacterium]